MKTFEQIKADLSTALDKTKTDAERLNAAVELGAWALNGAAEFVEAFKDRVAMEWMRHDVDVFDARRRGYKPPVFDE